MVCQFSTLTRWGGVETMLVDLLLHSNRQQVQYLLVTTSSDPEMMDVVRRAGILCYQPAGRFRYDPGKFLQMARWLRSHGVQVVHSYNAFANSWANITTLLGGIPVLFTGEHGTIWNVRPPIAWLDHWAHQRARSVIANSQAAAKMLELRYGVPVSKISVIYNGVAAIPPVDVREVRAQLGIKDNALVVGSIGRLDTPKDYATLINAAALVLKKRQDTLFVLVGGGPLENELRACAAEQGIQARFLFTGWRRDARTLMQAFDIFVSTSIRETFGNVLIEAALCAKPVIAPAIDGIPEAVIHEQTGLLLQPTRHIRQYQSPQASPIPKRVLLDGKLHPPRALDPEILAEAILTLLASSELRTCYGSQARERAQRLFSIERYMRDLEGFYLKAVNEL